MSMKSGYAPRNPVTLMVRMYVKVLPLLRKEQQRLLDYANTIPDSKLRAQALQSMNSKSFHLYGGSVYAAASLKWVQQLVTLIVNFQTISDYLDNVVEGSPHVTEQNFSRLHQSMIDCCIENAPLVDYYEFNEYKDDGGFLQNMVATCQAIIRQLPRYSLVQSYAVELADFFGKLQVYKHLEVPLREPKLLAFYEQHAHRMSHLRWNEFAAATGSTIGNFALFLAATDPELTEQQALQVRERYFPNMCSLHIMLDYMIDQAEDHVTNELNFCNYYANTDELVDRIQNLILWSRRDVAQLKDSHFHTMIVDGLLALYLSDAKIGGQVEVRQQRKRLLKGSSISRLFLYINSLYIRKIQ